MISFQTRLRCALSWCHGCQWRPNSRTAWGLWYDTLELLILESLMQISSNVIIYNARVSATWTWSDRRKSPKASGNCDQMVSCPESSIRMKLPLGVSSLLFVESISITCFSIFRIWVTMQSNNLILDPCKCCPVAEYFASQSICSCLYGQNRLSYRYRLYNIHRCSW